MDSSQLIQLYDTEGKSAEYSDDSAESLNKDPSESESEDTPVETDNEDKGKSKKIKNVLYNIIKEKSLKDGDSTAVEVHSNGKVISSITYTHLYKKITHLACAFSRIIKDGDTIRNIALVFPTNELCMFISAFHGCLMADFVPVTIVCDSKYNDIISEISNIMKKCNIKLAVTTRPILEGILKYINKERDAFIKGMAWLAVDIMDLTSNMDNLHDLVDYKNNIFCISFTGSTRKSNSRGSVVMLEPAIRQCSNFIKDNGITKDDVILMSIEPRTGIGLLISTIMSICLGSKIIFLENDTLTKFGVWLNLVRESNASYHFLYEKDLVNILESNGEVDFHSGHEGDLKLMKGIFVNSLFFNSILSFKFWEVMSQFGLDKRVLRRMLSPEILGGAIISSSYTSEIANNAEFYESIYKKSNSKDSFRGMANSTLLLYLADLQNKVVTIMGEADKVSDFSVVEDSESKVKALLLSDSGYISPKISVIVVDPVDNTILGNKMIGEIWVKSSDIPVERFIDQAHSQKILFNRVSYPNDSQKHNTDENGNEIYYTNTSLIGFIANRSSIDSFTTPRLFILGRRNWFFSYPKIVPSTIENKTHKSSRMNFFHKNIIVLSNIVTDFCIWSFPKLVSITICRMHIYGIDQLAFFMEVSTECSIIDSFVKYILQKVKAFFGISALLVFAFNTEKLNYQLDKSSKHSEEDRLRNLLMSLFLNSGNSKSRIVARTIAESKKNSRISRLKFLEEHTMDIDIIQGGIKDGEIFPGYINFDLSLASCLSNLISQNHQHGTIIKSPKCVFSTELVMEKHINKPDQFFGNNMQIAKCPKNKGSKHNSSKPQNMFMSITEMLISRLKVQQKRVAVTYYNPSFSVEKSKTYLGLDLNISCISHFLRRCINIKKRTRVLVVCKNSYRRFLAIHSCMYANLVPIIVETPEEGQEHFFVRTLLKAVETYFVYYIIVDEGADLKVQSTLRLLKEGKINIPLGRSAPQEMFNFTIEIIVVEQALVLGRKIMPNIMKFEDYISGDFPGATVQSYKKYAVISFEGSGTKKSFNQYIGLDPDPDDISERIALIMVYDERGILFVEMSNKVILRQCERIASNFFYPYLGKEYHEMQCSFSYFSNYFSLKNMGNLNSRIKNTLKEDNQSKRYFVLGNYSTGLGLLCTTMMGIYTGLETCLVSEFFEYMSSLKSFLKTAYSTTTTCTFSQASKANALYHMVGNNVSEKCDYGCLVLFNDSRDSAILFKMLEVRYRQFINKNTYFVIGSFVNPIICIRKVLDDLYRLDVMINPLHRNIIKPKALIDSHNVFSINDKKESINDKSSTYRDCIPISSSGRLDSGMFAIVRDKYDMNIIPMGYFGELWVASKSNANVLKCESSSLLGEINLSENLKHDGTVYTFTRTFIVCFMLNLDNMRDERNDFEPLNNMFASFYLNPNSLSIPHSVDTQSIISRSSLDIHMKSGSLSKLINDFAETPEELRIFATPFGNDSISINNSCYFIELIEHTIHKQCVSPVSNNYFVVNIGTSPQDGAFVILVELDFSQHNHPYDGDYDNNGSPQQNLNCNILMAAMTNFTARVLKSILDTHGIYPSTVAFVYKNTLPWRIPYNYHAREALRNRFMTRNMDIRYIVNIDKKRTIYTKEDRCEVLELFGTTQ